MSQLDWWIKIIMDNGSCSLHCIWKLWSIRKIIDFKYFNRALKFKVHVVILILIRCLWSLWFNIDLFILYFETQTWYRTVIGLWNSISQYMIWIDVYSSRPDSSGKYQAKWCGWTGNFWNFFNKIFPLLPPWKLGQIGLLITLLDSDHQEKSKTHSTCLIWWYFAWDI